MATRAKAKSKGRAEAAAPPLPAACNALLGREDVARALGCSLRHLDGLIAKGEFPGPTTHVAGKARWRCSDFNGWVEARAADIEGNAREAARLRDKAAVGMAAIAEARGEG